MNSSEPSLPVESYFTMIDAKPVIRDKFVSRQEVEKIVEDLGRAGLGPNQLQRFFRHCRKLQIQLRRKEKIWEEVRPSILMLPAHAVNGMHRPRDPIPQSFVDFITRNVNMIRTEDDFCKGFMKHFEAVLGYAPKHLRRSEH
jgi:CRISPR type III-A-associated protein Csm2